MSSTTVRVIRCAVVWFSTTSVLLGATFLFAKDLHQASTDALNGSLSQRPFETLLVQMCSLVAGACCVWLWVTSSAVILTVARGWPRPRLRGCPEIVRRAVLVACGIAVVGTISVPADAGIALPDTQPQSIRQQVSGLPLPERAIRDTRSIRPGAVGLAPAPESDIHPPRVRVRVGDTLWSIAEQTLGPDASSGAISDRWHALYELNRGVIGPDPDLILPDQQLRLGRAREESS